ncbi:MAG: 5-(carboxyamino)imidazole ribonucleotide synthase [Alphaproteobacteria bacterium]
MKVGIIGAGQLARMLSIAGTPLGLAVSVIGNPDDCGGDVVKDIQNIDLKDTDGLIEWAKTCDVITFENENIDCELVSKINDTTNVFPPIKAIEMAQDRLVEKNMLNESGIETAPFYEVNNIEDLKTAVDKYGLPAIVKTRRFGYDGKGQFPLKELSDIEKCWDEIGGAPDGLIYEGFVNFDLEVSQVASIDTNGNIAFYPLTENEHNKGILIKSTAPYNNDTLQAQAKDAVEKLAKSLKYVGTIAIEFFVCGDKLIANEIAPRVHNSGHWTIEGSTTSQFENHMRAVAGLSLGDTASKHTVMYNCIGNMPSIEATSKIKNLHRHDYNKEPRFARKVGHITISDINDTDIKETEKLVADSLDY